MAVPESLAFAGENKYKAGNSIVITGTNLDLVTGVTFSGNAAGEFKYSEGSLSVTIPASASDGEITLSTAAEKTVTTSSVTLVKPVITGFEASEVKAGETFTISGTDLDLVTGVTLNGVECTFTAASDKELTVNTVASSTSGKVAVSAANGYTAVSGTDMTVTYDSVVIVSSLTESVKPGEAVTMAGSNFNMIESIYVGDTKVTSYSSRSDSELVFEMPEVDAAAYNLEFVLTTGDRETCPIAIGVTGLVTTIDIWSGSLNTGTAWDSTNGVVNLAWQNLFNDIPDGCTLHVAYTTTGEADYSQLKLQEGNDWSALTSVDDANEWDCIDLQQGSSEVSYLLNETDTADLRSAGLIVAGYSVIVTRVYLTY